MCINSDKEIWVPMHISLSAIPIAEKLGGFEKIRTEHPSYIVRSIDGISIFTCRECNLTWMP